MKDKKPFYETPIGKRYYDGQLPDLIKSNNRLAEAQEVANELLAKRLKQDHRKLQLEHRKMLLEARIHNIDINEVKTNNHE